MTTLKSYFMKLIGAQPGKDIKDFPEVLRFLNHIDSINWGGCGISALAVHNWLKRYDEKSKIVFVYNDSEEFETNKTALQERNKVIDAPNHAVLYYKRRYYDSHGLYSMVGKKHLCLFVSKDVATECIKDANNWNPSFNRKKNIPLIKKSLNIKLV